MPGSHGLEPGPQSYGDKRGLKIPAPAPLKELQKWKRRWYLTEEMMEVLAAKFRTRKAIYARSWRYRTLIEAHRLQHSEASMGHGYGPDWKYMIKREVIDYAKKGILPLEALRMAAGIIETAENLAIVQAMVNGLVAKKRFWRKRIHIRPVAR